MPRGWICTQRTVACRIRDKRTSRRKVSHVKKPCIQKPSQLWHADPDSEVNVVPGLARPVVKKQREFSNGKKEKLTQDCMQSLESTLSDFTPITQDWVVKLLIQMGLRKTPAKSDGSTHHLIWCHHLLRSAFLRMKVLMICYINSNM